MSVSRPPGFAERMSDRDDLVLGCPALGPAARKRSGSLSQWRTSPTRQAVMPADTRTGGGNSPRWHLRQRVDGLKGTSLHAIKVKSLISA